jgi:Zn-dependent protease with chaperone function
LRSGRCCLSCRALWVRFEAPAGERLTRLEAPEFFALLGKLMARLDTPPVHQVLVTADFNAGVMQLPRLGIFGWHRNFLLLGLPLLRSLSITQLEAVLAHELGHLSRGHARLGNWMYRLRCTWQQLDQGLETRPHWGSGLIRRFLSWYAPYFSACSYPLARRSEFEADATSAQITTHQAAAQALTSVSVIDCYLSERYWPGVKARARDIPQPSFGPFSDYTAPAIAGTDADTQRRLAAALAARTSYSDSHPCLRERLEALGAEAQVALPAPGAAADQLLGAGSARFAELFDSHWRARVRDSWQKAYESTRQARMRLAQLHEQAASTSLSVEQGVELANLEENVGGGEAVALALRRQLVADHPNLPLVRFFLARQLLHRFRIPRRDAHHQRPRGQRALWPRVSCAAGCADHLRRAWTA